MRLKSWDEISRIKSSLDWAGIVAQSLMGETSSGSWNIFNNVSDIEFMRFRVSGSDRCVHYFCVNYCFSSSADDSKIFESVKSNKKNVFDQKTNKNRAANKSLKILISILLRVHIVVHSCSYLSSMISWRISGFWWTRAEEKTEKVFQVVCGSLNASWNMNKWRHQNRECLLSATRFPPKITRLSSDSGPVQRQMHKRTTKINI